MFKADSEVKLKLRDVFAYLGVILIEFALWQAHPAIAVGFLGVLLLAIGVWMATVENAGAKPVDPPRRTGEMSG